MSIFRICPLVVATTVVLAGLPFEPDLFAETAPPPMIVPQVTPRLNEPGPQLTIPETRKPDTTAIFAWHRVTICSCSSSSYRQASTHFTQPTEALINTQPRRVAIVCTDSAFNV